MPKCSYQKTQWIVLASIVESLIREMRQLSMTWIRKRSPMKDNIPTPSLISTHPPAQPDSWMVYMTSLWGEVAGNDTYRTTVSSEILMSCLLLSSREYNCNGGARAFEPVSSSSYQIQQTPSRKRQKVCVRDGFKWTLSTRRNQQWPAGLRSQRGSRVSQSEEISSRLR